MKLAFLSLTLIHVLEACPFSMGFNGPNPHEDGDFLLGEDRGLQERFSGTPAEAVAQAQADILQLITMDDDLGPKFLRLAFHDCVGGRCDGCVNLSNTANAGLGRPMEELAATVDRYQDQMTRADVWALAALTAVELMQGSHGPTYSFDYVGRATCGDNMRGGPDHQMPSNHITTGDLLTFFSEQFDFSDRETVAIMGAHSV